MSLHLSNRLIIGVVFAALSLFIAGAAAQEHDPIEIARACTAAVHTAANNTSEDMRTIRATTIDAVRALDEDDAADAAITAAGNAGRERINQRARAGVARVTGIVENCLDMLGDLDTPVWVEARVIRAGGNGIDRINAVRDRSTDAVIAAVRTALAD
ncbi:MAG: hypothetical protein AAGA55_11095 [Planctomycetota bacterium]